MHIKFIVWYVLKLTIVLSSVMNGKNMFPSSFPNYVENLEKVSINNFVKCVVEQKTNFAFLYENDIMMSLK